MRMKGATMKKGRTIIPLNRLIGISLASLLFIGNVTTNAAVLEDSAAVSEDVISDVMADSIIDTIDGTEIDTGTETNDGLITDELNAEQTVVEIPGEETSGPEYNYEDPQYLLIGESYYFESFENSKYDSYFPSGKRTQKPTYSKTGIVSCTKKKDKNGLLRFNFKAVKPGVVDIVFKTTFKGGSYTTKPYTLTVLKPVLTQTKFDNITSLNTTINMMDYVTEYEEYPRDLYVSWASSKPSVAEVDVNGLVTMKGPGSTKITGTFSTDYDGKVTVSATVTVKVPKMNKTAVTLVPGQKIKITLGNMPKGKTVDSWDLRSWGYKVRDDVYRDGLEKKEMGNSCEISAYMECGGTLTATVDGDTYTCDFTVKAPSIKKRTMTLKKGQSSKISVSGTKFKPNVFIYETSDPAVAIVDENGKVTAVGSGTAYIDVYLYQTRACARDDITAGGARVTVTVP